MKGFIRKRFFVASVFAYFFTAFAQAQQPILVSGQIAALEIVGGVSGAPGNYDLRIYLGVANQCNNQNWSYINVADPNYYVIAGALISAKAMHENVTLHIFQDSNGYCALGYIDLN